MPTVSCSPVSIAMRSLVPTPSVLDTRIGSRKPAAFGSNSAPNPPSPPNAGPPRGPRERFDRFDQRVAGIDIHARRRDRSAVRSTGPSDHASDLHWPWRPSIR
jgi:hypothetical protein